MPNATTMAELNDLAKDYFSTVYRQLQNPEVALKAQFARLTGAIFTGRKFIFGVKTAIGGGAANSTANKQLPAPDEGKYDQGEATLVRTYTRMALDLFAAEVTKQQAGSYKPAVAETMEDRLQAHDLEVNRQLFCNGDGKVALVPTGAASATQTLGSDYGVVGGGAGARHVHVGDMLEFFSSDGSTSRGVRTVIAVDRSTQAVTLDSSVTTSNGDFASKATPDTSNKASGEVLGLLASVKDSGTFETIPAGSNWKSVRDHNNGSPRPLTDAILLHVIAQVRAISRQVPDLAVTQPGVTLKYSESFLPLRRIMGQDIELKGGYKPVSGIQHAGGVIPVLEDLDTPDGRLFLLNTDAFRMADLIGANWFDGDGAQFSRITDKDAVEGYIRKYWQLITIGRNMNAVIEDLDTYTDIVRG